MWRSRSCHHTLYPNPHCFLEVSIVTDFEIRKKKKHVKAEEFVKEIKEIHKKAKVMLKKITGENEKIYRQE